MSVSHFTLFYWIHSVAFSHPFFYERPSRFTCLHHIRRVSRLSLIYTFSDMSLYQSKFLTYQYIMRLNHHFCWTIAEVFHIRSVMELAIWRTLRPDPILSPGVSGRQSQLSCRFFTFWLWSYPIAWAPGLRRFTLTGQSCVSVESLVQSAPISKATMQC